MIPQSSRLETVARFAYNQSLSIAPNGEIIYRRSLPVESKKKDTRELKDIQASVKRIQNFPENVAPSSGSDHEPSSYEFQSYMAWFQSEFKNLLIPKDKKKVGYGLLSPKWKNFTKKAQRQLRYGAAAMELKLGKERCKFFTLTVPGSTPEATRVIAEYSGYINNRIQTWITDNFTHSDGRKYSLGVIEIQKRGMLHWHFLVGLESFFYYEKLATGIETLWYEILSQLSEMTGVSLFERHDGYDWKPHWEKIKHRAVRVENVEKSVSNYLAKYLSKNQYRNVSEVQYKGVKYKVYPPSAWYTRSQDVIELIAEYTIRYDLNPIPPSLVDECTEFAKDIFNSFGFWTVKTLNPYTKQQIGVLARGKYEDAKECGDILASILNEVGLPCRQEVDRSYKAHHSEDFRITKELDRQLQESDIIEYMDAQGVPYFMRRKSQHKIHKQYWNAIKSGQTMEEAFKSAGMG